MKKKISITVVGLGYIGLPLLYELSKFFKVIGIDNNKARINTLKKGIDVNKQISKNEIKQIIPFLHNKFCITRKTNVYIVTVPTPVFKNKNPDISALISATKSITRLFSKGDTIIYESKVYTGLIEEIAEKYISQNNDFVLNKDFFLGYSPERMNPGDNIHTLQNITKIISGSNLKTVNLLKKIYGKICNNIHIANSIKIAESSKIIENVQRDINIALVNEFSQLFHKLDVPFKDVIEAAKTKWNFLNFTPGLVGGHCIGVDPYYLTYIAKRNNHIPKLILNGRSLNDNMYKYVSQRIFEYLKKKYDSFDKLDVLLLGLTFKENCNDIRNSQSIKLYNHLKKKIKNLYAYEPYLNIKEKDKSIKNVLTLKTK